MAAQKKIKCQVYIEYGAYYETEFCVYLEEQKKTNT